MLGETLTCFLFGDNLVNGNNIVEKNSLIGGGIRESGVR
jgi:hypothetical protein